MVGAPAQGMAPEVGAALRAVGAGCAEVMRVYRGAFEAREKGDGSPVTDADIGSDRAIREALAGSGHPVLSEEGGGPGGVGEALWVVDPLDGTSDFVDRTGEFTVMVALVRGGAPVIGVIGWPAGGETYAAQAGLGAYRMRGGAWERIRASAASDLSACRAVGSRHHMSGPDMEFIGSLGMAGFEAVGSSLKAARIASGGAEAYITTTDRMREWDTAASCCIVGEAGGRMTDMSGGPLEYGGTGARHPGGILATNGPIHDRIVSAFRGARAPGIR